VTITPLRFLKDNGLCAQADPELFYPQYDSPSFTEDAIAVCDRCPVRAECLDWALDHEEQGVWGGTSEATRRSLKRPRQRRHCIICQSTNVVTNTEETRGYCVSCGLSWLI